MARILVVYFSLTGHTKQVAEAIAHAARADIEAIRDSAGRDYSPPHLFWFAMEAMLHQLPDIEASVHDPAAYDLVAIGTPNWAGTATPPAMAYINRHKGQFRQVALFCSEGGQGGEKVLAQMAEAIGLKPQAELIVTEPQLTSGALQGMAEEFAHAITAAAAAGPSR
jgi:flavodoxin